MTNYSYNEMILSIGEMKIKIGGFDGDNKGFKHLGSLKEDAEGDDVIIGNKSIGTRENDLMDYYGTIVKSPESNADSDTVLFSVPSEQVYASVSVLGSDPKTSSENTLQIGSLIVKDDEIASISNKNQIIVGGSCINKESARLLGVPFGTCGETFTQLTGVNTGQYLLQTFNSTTNPEKVVVLIAGYNAEDTTRGVNELLNSNKEIVAGIKTIN
jgi:hypothetical protein